MKVKKVISEGTMCPKLVCEGEFLNPITQETQTCEITACITREMIPQIAEELKKDPTLPTFRELCRKEFESSHAQFQYNKIKEYAEEHNSLAITDEYLDTVWKHIHGIINTAKTPKVIMDVRMIHELSKRDPDIKQTQEQTSGPIYHYCTVTSNGKPVKIYAYSYAPWTDCNCLAYDEENPKNCKLVMYL